MNLAVFVAIPQARVNMGVPNLSLSYLCKNRAKLRSYLFTSKVSKRVIAFATSTRSLWLVTS